MIISDKFTVENGLFASINSHVAFEWAQIFTPVKMDLFFILTQGNARLVPAFESVEIDTLGALLAEMYVDKWNKIYNNLYAGNLNILGVTDKITETIDNDATTTTTSDKSTIGDISAFDTSEYSPKDKTTDKSTDKTLGESNTTRTKIREGHNADYLKNSSLMLNIFTNNFLYDIIIADVKKLIIVPIY